MVDILHQLIGSFPIIYKGIHTSQVVQDFFHQQYHVIKPTSLKNMFNTWLTVGLGPGGLGFESGYP